MVSEVITSRLFHILPHIIDETQGAFLKHRGVTPIALAELEIIHHIVNAPPTKHHSTNIALKLNLTKAFDCIE